MKGSRLPPVPFLLLVASCVLGSCGGAGREVLAHHPNGNLRARHREVPAEDGRRWTKEGPAETWHANGERASRGAYRDGLAWGTWTHWDASGAKRAEGVRRDTREGPWTFWTADGALEARGSFLFGGREGLWIYRRPDGSVDPDRSGVYEADVRVAEAAVDGRVTEWYDDGTPRYRHAYRDGVRHGPAQAWYADGRPRYEGSYELGRKSGTWTYWESDGTRDEARSGRYDGWRRVGPLPTEVAR